MKRLFFILTLCAFIAPVVMAQTTLYITTVDSLQGTGVTTTGKTTAGYDVYKKFTMVTTMPAYDLTAINIKFSKTTDSVRLYGGWIDFGTDTVWVPLQMKIKFPMTSINTGAGVGVKTDTTVSWLTPIYTANYWGANAVIDMREHNFSMYKTASGLNDTGKTYIGYIRKLRPVIK